jgi:hypothetical protein
VSAVLDADDIDRIRHTEARLAGVRIAALARIPDYTLLPRHREFVRLIAAIAPETMNVKQQDHVLRLCWIYRAKIGRNLAPRCNPDDPIVTQLRQRERAHG